MGQAKRRGTFEERVAQARERQAREREEWRVRAEAAEKQRREEYQKRVDAGEAIPLDMPRRRPVLMPLMLGALVAGSLAGRNRRGW